jgi:hypothetical protein
MNPAYYQHLFTGVMAALAIIVGGVRVSSPDNRHQLGGGSLAFPLLLCVVLTIWIGFRPVSSAFGDTVSYALIYSKMNASHISMDWSSEWIWQWLMNGCKAAGLSIHSFFFAVAIFYVFSALWAVKRLMPSDPMLGMLFVLTSLMFFTFATNGLRNGLACHLALLAFSFLMDDKWIPGALFALLALGIHRSVLLPIIAILVGIFLLKDVRYAIVFWVASIFLSLAFGNTVTGFFASMGFDDRLTQYTQAINDYSEFSREGFRWDFLLYSAIPVVMSWYVCVHKGVTDNWYNALCVAYCLCNAFWIMVIRSAFSNRFAYLSWFMYPIIIAYPLVNLPVREDQDRFTGWALIAYAAFSVFMWFVFW